MNKIATLDITGGYLNTNKETNLYMSLNKVISN